MGCHLTIKCNGNTVRFVQAVHIGRELVVRHPEQLKALADATRTRILQILDDRPASAKQLAGLLDMSHGRIGHHLKVLEAHGFIEVVETRQVRAMTEKLFGPTFSRLRVELSGDAKAGRLQFLFSQAAREAAPDSQQPFDELGRLYAVRMPTERAADFSARLVALADEFAAAESDGPMFGLAASVYLVDMPGETS